MGFDATIDNLRVVKSIQLMDATTTFISAGGVDIEASLTALDTTEFGYLDGVTAGTAAASKAVVLDSSAQIDALIFDGTGSMITLAGTATTGINFTGTIERGIDFGSMTVGTTTDGVLMRAGTGIGSSGLAFGTASQRAIALYLRPTATSGTFKGMRLRSIADAASGSSLNVDNFHCQASVIASKDAAVINCGFFETIFKGTNDVDWGRCILTNVDSAASVTISAGLVNTHIRTHTRGDETMSGVDEQLRIENEAVGGNGRSMDSYIRCMATNVNVSGADYLIDGGVATNLVGTAVLRLPDDGTICEASAAGTGNADGADFVGFIKVVIGTTDMYIPLLAGTPAAIFT